MPSLKKQALKATLLKGAKGPVLSAFLTCLSAKLPGKICRNPQFASSTRIFTLLIMSVASNLEEGTAGQLSGERADATNSSVSGSVRELQKNCTGKITKGWIYVEKNLDYIKKSLDLQGPLGIWICLTLIVIAISLDPLFFYIPVVNDGRKCLILDKKLGITATLLRSIFDVFYIIFISFGLRTDLRGDDQQKDAWKHLLHFFLIDIVAILPLPQVVTLIMITTMRGSKFLNDMKLLKFFVFFQHVPRVIRIYPLFTKATSISGKLAEAVWPRAAFNLLLYMLAGHVFGAFWYFLAIERETVCWKKACKNHNGCVDGSFYCDDHTLGNYTFLNDVCPTTTRNATTFDFGIFQDALQSGIVEVTGFPHKFLYCFKWGLQNLSCFGQNLQTSSYVWENLFAILITICGLVLFTFLIGNMQVYLQSKTVRSEEMRLKAREIEEWTPFKKLSENLQQQVKKYHRYIWQKTNGVDLENLFNNLPRDLRMNIKRELCLDLLKKVEEFKNLNEATLDALCDCVKPAFYIERTYVVREEDPIDEMLFVVHGKLWTYTRTTGSGSSDLRRGKDDNKTKKDHLKDGDLCGEELVAWAMNDPSSSNLPMSTITIQALTKVEAFALMADDLKTVFIRYNLSSSSELNFNQAVLLIQNAWRRRQTRRNWQRAAGAMEPGLQAILSHSASVRDCLQNGRSSKSTLSAPSQHQAGPEINLEQP